jgi:putative Mg2+ transporter-C (MgtC) family protein
LQQAAELLLAFLLSSVVGLERQFRGKSAGLRTQTIVGTASALILLVSKYGFADVLAGGTVVLDPSRVAAQIVSGVGFLGAGLIITRHGAIRGLTTAAAVWETAAIGMAAGAGLPMLAVLVTALHFVIVLAYTPLAHLISARGRAEGSYTVTYQDGRGVLRDLLAACTSNAWTVRSVAVLDGTHAMEVSGDGRRLITIELALDGSRIAEAPARLGEVRGVVRVDRGESEDDE